MRHRFDPREWSTDRLTFAGYKLLGLLFTVSRRSVHTPGYDEAVLVRRRDRNAFEAYSIALLYLALYLSAGVAMLEMAGMPDWLIAVLFPLPALLMIVLLMLAIFLGGTMASFAARMAGRAHAPRVLGIGHLAIGSVSAAILILHSHWTRWIGVAWCLLLALNAVASIAALALRPLMRRVSDELWKETPFVD